jgi:hypothetical protein
MNGERVSPIRYFLIWHSTLVHARKEKHRVLLTYTTPPKMQVDSVNKDMNIYLSYQALKPASLAF